jgi:hypothetical protein
MNNRPQSSNLRSTQQAAPWEFPGGVFMLAARGHLQLERFATALKLYFRFFPKYRSRLSHTL